MGTHFFTPKGGSRNSGSNTNLTARSYGASAYTARAAAGGVQKDLAAAKALKSGFKRIERGSAIAPGPKKV